MQPINIINNNKLKFISIGPVHILTSFVNNVGIARVLRERSVIHEVASKIAKGILGLCKRSR